MGSLKSVFFGILLVVASCVLLFWAEGRAVKTARALEEGAAIVIPVDANQIDPANEGKLVHISGTAVPQDVPKDQRLGVTAEGAVSLTRKVEMFQWKEVSREVERTANDGAKTKSTVYDYEQVWSDSAIDSSRFKTASAPVNPPMPLTGEAFRIAEARLGAFRLYGNDVAPLGKPSPVGLSQDGIAAAADGAGIGGPTWLTGNRYVIADDPDKPAVGDLRIGFERADVDRVSAVGAQKGDGLTRFVASNGREIFLIQNGSATAGEMFKDAISSNTALTWVIRIGGLILMLVGFKLTFGLLTGISDNIPLLGSLIRASTTLVSVVMTLALGSVVIALGWIFYRPLLALAVLIGGLAIAAATGYLGRKKADAARPAST